MNLNMHLWSHYAEIVNIINSSTLTYLDDMVYFIFIPASRLLSFRGKWRKPITHTLCIGFSEVFNKLRIISHSHPKLLPKIPPTLEFLAAQLIGDLARNRHSVTLRGTGQPVPSDRLAITGSNTRFVARISINNIEWWNTGVFRVDVDTVVELALVKFWIGLDLRFLGNQQGTGHDQRTTGHCRRRRRRIDLARWSIRGNQDGTAARAGSRVFVSPRGGVQGQCPDGTAALPGSVGTAMI